MVAKGSAKSEAATRIARIDPKLRAQGWEIVDLVPATPLASYTRHAVREYPTVSGPADYVLFVRGRLVGIIEAKKGAVDPQNVLTQAERYARGLPATGFNVRGFHVPFIYSTNGEQTWFHDVRSEHARSRELADFHTPAALTEALAHDLDAACAALAVTPNEPPKIRPYQREANEGVEQVIRARKRRMLLAMATGTGKTFTMVNQIYRLMKSGAVKRVLFLVDRRSLAAQAVRAFASFAPEASLKFDKIYEVYSQAFRRDDLDVDDDDVKFDPKQIPAKYLMEPDPAKPFVYVCTIQRMAINLFGKGAVFNDDEGAAEESDADLIPMPIHAFDLVVADECHRGYTSAEVSTWRNTLDHFDAIKIGLTATPIDHTIAYFETIAARYNYRTAVSEGHLVDFDKVHVKSEVRINGVFLQEGDGVEIVDLETGQKRFDAMEDERTYEAAQIERKITAPESNRKIVEELKKYALAHEAKYGRFPKTLIFAVNDLPKASHAQQLVNVCRDVFDRGNDFVQKITGNRDVDRPLQRIKEFRNREQPSIVVTVDMLSTGVDIPDLEFIVFLRPVKSRVLFTQMLGRGTRKGLKHPDKSHFTVFDCFDGTLLAYFEKVTDMTEDMPASPSRTIQEMIEDIWKNKEREYNTRCVVKRLQRIAKEMSGEARELFAAHIPDGDLAAFATALPTKIRDDFTVTMKLLRDPAFQKLLVSYPRPRPDFLVAYGVADTVSSTHIVRDAVGNEYKAEDYLDAFVRCVNENQDRIGAIRVLLDRPKSWSTAALSELKRGLAATEQQFTEARLQAAHAAHYKKDLVDLISMVKHAARATEPLLTAAERVDRALGRLTAGTTISAEQQPWLDRIRAHLVENLSIDRDDFDDMPIFNRLGGWKPANDAWKGQLAPLLAQINEAIAA
jgi:type I restriction enzyme R subunit